MQSNAFGVMYAFCFAESALNRNIEKEKEIFLSSIFHSVSFLPVIYQGTFDKTLADVVLRMDKYIASILAFASALRFCTLIRMTCKSKMWSLMVTIII